MMVKPIQGHSPTLMMIANHQRWSWSLPRADDSGDGRCVAHCRHGGPLAVVDDHAKKLDDDRRAATAAEAIRINWFFRPVFRPCEQDHSCW